MTVLRRSGPAIAFLALAIALPAVAGAQAYLAQWGTMRGHLLSAEELHGCAAEEPGAADDHDPPAHRASPASPSP